MGLSKSGIQDHFRAVQEVEEILLYNEAGWFVSGREVSVISEVLLH